jgi:glycosyltransferase involved in cell wall biosynthesis
MRILQVHNRYRQAGGEDTVVDAERALLASAGHLVTAFEAENPTETVPTVANLVMSPWNPLSATRLGRMLDGERPDVAHVHNTWYSLSASVLSTLRRRDIPVVATVHNYRMTCLNGQLYRDGRVCEDCVGTWPTSGIRHACYRGSKATSVAVAAATSLGRSRDYWQRSIDRFVVMTAFSRDILVRTGIPAESIWIKPHFAADPGERADQPSTSDTVLFVGRLAHEKGVVPLVRAWAAADTGDLKLKIVGEGPQLPELAATLPEGVELAGWLPREEVAAEMRRARALVFPSVWYETFGMVLIEAMATGLPVLASAIAGVPETVGDALPLPRPDHQDDWVEALGELTDDSLVDHASAIARKRYVENYSEARGLSDLEALYRSVL